MNIRTVPRPPKILTVMKVTENNTRALLSMISSGFVGDKLVIDVHDEFGGGPGKIDQRY